MYSCRHFINLLNAYFIFQAAWTKGRLNCPKCQCRVGGFDFVGGSEHPIHLIKSKVDLWKKTATTVIVTEEDTIGNNDLKS